MNVDTVSAKMDIQIESLLIQLQQVEQQLRLGKRNIGLG